MPSDFLTSLLANPGTAVSSDPSPEDDATVINSARSAVSTGVIPPETPIPSYGPIGAVLQALGIRRSSEPTPSSVYNYDDLARKEFANSEADRKLQAIQGAEEVGTQFGGKAASSALTSSGFGPEMAGVFPNVPGRGALQMSAQELKIMQMMNSQDLKEKELGIREAGNAIKEAASQGRMEVAQAMMQVAQGKLELGQQRESFSEGQKDREPVEKTGQMLLGHLQTRISDLTKLKYQLGVSPEQTKGLDAEIDDLEEQTSRVMAGMSTAKSPEDLFALRGKRPAVGEGKTDKGKGGIKKGLFGDTPTPRPAALTGSRRGQPEATPTPTSYPLTPAGY